MLSLCRHTGNAKSTIYSIFTLIMLFFYISGYTGAKYAPTRPQILLGPGRGIPSELRQIVNEKAVNAPFKLSTIRELYPHFEYSDLAAHPAMVLFPYQISIMTIFELYRMGIPLFVPSPSLLVDWHKKYGILQERTWPGVHNHPVENSVISRHPLSTSIITDQDPNNEFNRDAIMTWIKLADFYIWPNITTFDSFDHLLTLLGSVDFAAVSRDMLLFSAREEIEIRSKWEKILSTASAATIERNRSGRVLPKSINSALMPYGMKLSEEKCSAIDFTVLPLSVDFIALPLPTAFSALPLSQLLTNFYFHHTWLVVTAVLIWVVIRIIWSSRCLFTPRVKER
jgi:hypothetical protein